MTLNDNCAYTHSNISSSSCFSLTVCHSKYRSELRKHRKRRYMIRDPIIKVTSIFWSVYSASRHSGFRDLAKFNCSIQLFLSSINVALFTKLEDSKPSVYCSAFNDGVLQGLVALTWISKLRWPQNREWHFTGEHKHQKRTFITFHSQVASRDRIHGSTS